jgi:hypothetical protein
MFKIVNFLITILKLFFKLIILSITRPDFLSNKLFESILVIYLSMSYVWTTCEWLDS